MKKIKIAILGGGNIGTSLAKGLVRSEQYKIEEIILGEKRESRISFLKNIGFNVTDDNTEAISDTDIIIMAVKPQQFETLREEIKDGISPRHLLISTITGITHREIENAFGVVPNMRIMPNTAVEICESMTCMSFRNMKPEQEKMITSIFEKMGRTIVIPEELIDAATVTGSCGIAFALRFMRAMSQGGIEIGFNAEMSQQIVAQTVLGAARMILLTSGHPESEIDKVTTPQGITISGLNEMEHQGFSSAVIKGLTTSFGKLGNLAARSRK
ncbi:MAG TPA: pyrroline-5-carboxylate reductase [Bacteroidales bacterium]|nr:pyrroline-5-carboxylate reductase [Bacteroidales bacterium]HOX75456.1 pyrroline-5-carboxylate reductase [Bacteroidales bacterium]HPM88957.1 pyrroline-5-carboxylate reductase [Bacteroidales bacterium]HQM70571.1 pyrroline-5-carboxylate reductase [Bacteroidales bacterium]